MLVAQITELGRVADIDDAKRFVVLAETQRNFTVAAGQVVNAATVAALKTVFRMSVKISAGDSPLSIRNG